MSKRSRKSSSDETVDETSSSDISISFQNTTGRKRSLSALRYLQTQNKDTADYHISDFSSDEGATHVQPKEEDKKLASRRNCQENYKLLSLNRNKFKPLQVTVNTHRSSSSAIASTSALNSPNVTKNAAIPPSTPNKVWRSLKETLSILRADCRSAFQSSFSNSTRHYSLNRTADKSSTTASLETNLTADYMVDKQILQPDSAKKSTAAVRQQSCNETREETSSNVSLESNLTAENVVDRQIVQPRFNTNRRFRKESKERCKNGGYLQRYMRMVLKNKMDRRFLRHNKRLGISSGQRVNVLAVLECFGTHMARVKSENDSEIIFNIIVDPSIVTEIHVGSRIEIYFDLSEKNAMRLPNNELVYIQPNKLLIL